jgi:1-acyl-sn-glycerol-3-phosphate acyltransferase
MSPDRLPAAVDPEDLRRFREALAHVPVRQGWVERLLRTVIRAWCRLVAWRIVTTVAALPEQAGVAAAGCVVVAAPHRAWVEPFLLVAAWPPAAARLVWLADGRTVTRSWWRRRLLPRLGVIPVAATMGGPRAYAQLASAACERGLAVAVFPEVGPPSPPDQARRISRGFAYVSLQAGAPVVPVVVGGTHRIVRGSTFSLDIGATLGGPGASSDPFTPEGQERARALTERYERFVAAALPERTRQADAAAPARERWTWLGSLFE